MVFIGTIGENMLNFTICATIPSSQSNVSALLVQVESFPYAEIEKKEGGCFWKKKDIIF